MAKQSTNSMNVVLNTKDGQLVTEWEIPMFDAAPDVLLFGDRTFRHCYTSVSGVAFYAEVFAYALV